MKQLRTIKEPDNLDGFSFIDKKGYEIYVNVEKLWKQAKTRAKHPIDTFIANFNNTLIHEILHYVIELQYTPRNKWEYGEEMIIWSLMNEKIPKTSLKFYQDEYLSKSKKKLTKTVQQLLK